MIRLYDEFCGVGGTSHGGSMIPGVGLHAAANHDPDAIASHAANFPAAQHFQADVTKLDMAQMPYAELFSASPACPAWTTANGVRRDFDMVNAEPAALFEMPDDDADEDPKLAKRRAEYRRSRLLMHEVPRYLRGMIDRNPGRPVLAGMVENVIQCRLWSEWDAWIGEFHKLGYRTRLIAFNSMHARPVRALRAPQSRNRLFLAYWHESLRRTPDFDKWLRPEAYCPTCDKQVYAMQVFKQPGTDMGSYGEQYVYRCPQMTCRQREVFPEVLPALAAIDLSIPGRRIGDRVKPLAEATMDRIAAGIRRYWEPLLVPTGGTWRTEATALSAPMPTRTTRESDGVALLPPLVMRNFTARGDQGQMTTPASEPLRTLTTTGKQSVLTPPPLLVPFYSASESAAPATAPVGTLTTRDRYGLGTFDPATAGTRSIDVDDVLFRMLQPHEVGRAMAFHPSYQLVAKAKKTRIRLYGNAVTPPVAEVIMSALVECITGEQLARELPESDLVPA